MKVFLKRKLRKDKWVWNISKKLSMRWSAFRKIYDLLSFFSVLSSIDLKKKISVKISMMSKDKFAQESNGKDD